MIFFKVRWIGWLLILLGIGSAVCFWNAQVVESGWEKELRSLPNYDYCARVRQLIVEKKYEEALTLCEDIIIMDLPQSKEAADLKVICETELRTVKHQLWRGVCAFLTGDPGESTLETCLALLSDMIIYGDVRDLVKQGYFKVTGHETDLWISILASVGLAVETVDVVDWMPALTKGLRKAKILSDSLLWNFVLNFKSSVGKYKNTVFVRNIKKVFECSGGIRTQAILRNVETTEDFLKIAGFSEKAVSGTHLLVEVSGKNTVRVIEKITAGKNLPAFSGSCFSKVRMA